MLCVEQVIKSPGSDAAAVGAALHVLNTIVGSSPVAAGTCPPARNACALPCRPPPSRFPYLIPRRLWLESSSKRLPLRVRVSSPLRSLAVAAIAEKGYTTNITAALKKHGNLVSDVAESCVEILKHIASHAVAVRAP